MNYKDEVLATLDEVLGLNGRAASFSLDTPLLGAIPELDSMAVVSLVAGLEDRFGISIGDDELEGSIFATVESLMAFVQAKVEGA